MLATKTVFSFSLISERVWERLSVFLLKYLEEVTFEDIWAWIIFVKLKKKKHEFPYKHCLSCIPQILIFYFHYSSKYFLVFFVIYSLARRSFRSIFLNFYTFWNFLLIFVYGFLVVSEYTAYNFSPLKFFKTCCMPQHMVYLWYWKECVFCSCRV